MEAATKWTNEDEETLADQMAPEGEAVEPEPEPSSEPDGEEPELEPEPEEEARMPSSATIDAEQDKALTAETKRHENALKKAYGDSFDRRVRCIPCDGEGFFEPSAEYVATIIAMADEVRAAQGETAAIYPHPEELMLCTRCDGWGNVSTGARNEHTAVIPCSACESRGYFDTNNVAHRAKLGIAPELVVAPVVQFPVFHQPEQAAVIEAPLSPPAGWVGSGRIGADSWGRWPGHPRHGIDPAASGGAW